MTDTGAWRPTLPPLPVVEAIPPAYLARLLAEGGATPLDVGPSPAYRRGRVPGARFIIRARLAADLPAAVRGHTIVVTSPDGLAARFAAADIQALTGRPALVLDGGTDAWRAAGLQLDSGEGVFLSAPDDVYRRPYEGTDNAVEAMQAYLDWEYGLVGQLRRDGTHGFFVIPPSREAHDTPPSLSPHLAQEGHGH
ncbi:rhodanese-like domain-containing protein [Nitrospirillum sp. BR 11164]|uniref:rhodanese-like domain-containing protein n=1 Tax=Nitrospirillum sp. BR 11164 TaxID=3104324 RepID=UPI002AFDDAEC|nr:rhodanese-like domain-containing protein [Nitrospirillum sp. BR 11164]MEA1652203.1 rhodanese-like domain-containing protein [Nitrospirillum sp. BR 11164]